MDIRTKQKQKTKTQKIRDSTNTSRKEVWDFLQEYNLYKWKAKEEKDTFTYHKTRKEDLKEMYSNQERSEIPPETYLPQNG